MNKYYIPEINLKQIKNNNILKKLENKFHMTTKKLEIIITNGGFYKLESDKLENDKFIKYKIINKNSFIKENFIKNMTLIGMNYYHKKIGEVFHIPYEHAKITIEQITFSVGKESKHFLVIEKIKNKINDLYFLSSKKIDEDNIFFLNDIQSFIETLNVQMLNV